MSHFVEGVIAGIVANGIVFSALLLFQGSRRWGGFSPSPKRPCHDEPS